MYLQREQIETLYQLIKENDQIIIHRHVRPDPDALGSQYGLKYLIEGAFPNKKVKAAGTVSQGLSWLAETEEVTAEDYREALVIVVDTANVPRIDGKLHHLGQQLVKIDHHPVVDLFGDLQIVHTEASSCSEIIAEISHYLGDRLPMNAKAAQILYAGIVGDTGRFLYNSTTTTTFNAAARLLAFDFNAFEISDRFQTMTIKEAKFQGYILDNLRISDEGVADVMISREDLANFGITEEQTNAVVGLPSQIEGVLTWVIFVEQEGANNSYRCRIRSKGPVINEIAANHHGGGHPKASGAKAYNFSEVEQIIEELKVASLDYHQKEIDKNN